MCGFIHWMHHWQELIGAIVGAGALLLTVWFTLGSERRKRKEEANALRVALGAEMRQFAVRTLDIYRSVAALVRDSANRDGIGGARIKRIVRFSDPVIYPQCAARLGMLGQYAFSVVHFYNQLALVDDVVEQLSESSAAQKDQLHNILGALLNAAEIAAESFSAFSGTPRSEHDGEFRAAVVAERVKYNAFQKTPSDG